MSEMVLDGGGHFIPAGIFGLHRLYLLLSSQAAHDRATVDSHTHDIKLNWSTVHKTRQGGINSVPL